MKASSPLRALFREPARICLHVYHRYGSAELKLRYQLEQERGRRLPGWKCFIDIRFLIPTEKSVCGNAAKIEPSLCVAAVQRIAKWLSERRVPISFKC
jgi:hypothetical protein